MSFALEVKRSRPKKIAIVKGHTHTHTHTRSCDDHDVGSACTTITTKRKEDACRCVDVVGTTPPSRCVRDEVRDVDIVRGNRLICRRARVGVYR